MIIDTAGPQIRALFTTRRWLVVMLTGLLVVVTSVAGARRWSELNTVEHVGMVLAVTLAIAGATTSRNPRRLWLCDASVLVLALTALAAPDGSPPWIPMPNVASYTAFMAILLTSRRTGFIIACAGAAFVALIWWRHPTNIIASALELWGGWIVVVQILVTALAAWWAWNTVLDEALEADHDFEQRELSADQSIAEQERARLWRSTAAQLHESLLNSIRYVLATPEPNREQLAGYVGGATHPPDAPVVHSIDRLLADVLDDPIAADIIQVPASRPDAELEPEVFDALRGALIEVAHNSARHGGATQLQVEFETDPSGLLTVHADDNGSGISGRSRPGIGTEVVLSRSVAAVGGTVRMTSGRTGGTDVTLTVPAEGVAPQRWLRTRSYPPFDKGRLLVSASLAGACVVGIVYFLILWPVRSLDRTGGSHFWLTVVFGIVGCAIPAIVVLRRRQLALLAGLGLIMIPALVPWFLRTADYGCAQSANVASVINVAGFAVVAIAAWAGLLPGAAGVIMWATGTLIVLTNLPAACNQGVQLALSNSLLVIPLALTVTYVGVRTDQRAETRMNTARRREVLEQSRSAAEADLNSDLEVAVDDASALLAAIAAGQPRTPEVRVRLEAADARIRAAIQVDSARAGTFARVAKRVVDSASTAGTSVTVRAVGGSDDTRPISAHLELLVTQAVSATRTRQPVIQVFTDGTTDYLSALVDLNGLTLAGLRAGENRSYGDVTVDVLEEEADPEADSIEFSLLLSRKIASHGDVPLAH